MKFDLERFKAGEVAIDQFGDERIYLATSPTGELVCWNNSLRLPSSWTLEQIDGWIIKPKEEWVLVSRDNRSGNVYGSKKDAEDDCTDLNFWEAVKIIRE